MDPFTVGIASTIAGPILSSLFPKAFGGKTEWSGVDPAQYKDELTYSEGDLSQMEQAMMDKIYGGQSQVAANIKQEGAAGRLPFGAISSSLKGLSGETGKAITGVKPKLSEMKRKSLMDYLNMQRQYDTQKMGFEQQQAGGAASWMQGGLGTLAQLMMTKGLMGGQGGAGGLQKIDPSGFFNSYKPQTPRFGQFS